MPRSYSALTAFLGLTPIMVCRRVSKVIVVTIGRSGAPPADAFHGGLDLLQRRHGLDPEGVHPACRQGRGLFGEALRPRRVTVQRAKRRHDLAGRPYVDPPPARPRRPRRLRPAGSAAVRSSSCTRDPGSCAAPAGSGCRQKELVSDRPANPRRRSPGECPHRRRGARRSTLRAIADWSARPLQHGAHRAIGQECTAAGEQASQLCPSVYLRANVRRHAGSRMIMLRRIAIIFLAASPPPTHPGSRRRRRCLRQTRR